MGSMTTKPEPSGLYSRRAHWILPCGDGVVTEVSIDFCFSLVVETWIVIRISTPFTIFRSGVTMRFDPEDTASLAPLVTLHQKRVTEALIRMDGNLKVTFSDGSVLCVEPNAHYEAFQVSGKLPPVERKFEFISLPGGGLARM